MIGLSDRDISELLTPKELIAAVEDAARLHDDGRAVVAERHHLEWSGNILLTMPAVAAGALGTKLVSVVPNNAARGLPVTNGLTVLNDAETGPPLALLNAAALTGQRTGAVGALGTKYMTPIDLDSVGIIGTGVQGTCQAVVTCAVRPIREVFYVCRSSASGERFGTAVKQHAPEVQLTRCRNASELLTRTSLVITAATSIEPVLPDKPALLEGKHFISIGSFRPNMQELPDSVYRLAGELAVDSESARHEVGDIMRPLERGILEWTDVFFIGQLVTGRCAVDVSHTTAYKSVGMALYDVVVAKALYDAAKLRGIGREIEI